MPASSEQLASPRARWLYPLTIVIAAFGLLATAQALISAYRSIRVGPTAGHHVVLLGLRLTYPRVNLGGAAVLLLACFGVVAIFRGCAAAVRLRRIQRRFLGELSVHGRLPGHGEMIVFEHVRAQAFCAGYLRPCV